MKESNILLIDISARIPYGLKCNCGRNTYDILGVYYTLNDEMEWEYMVSLNGFAKPVSITSIKPYLRSMSSMTEEEKKEYYTFQYKFTLQTHEYQELNKETFSEYLDWLNKNMFDYRGLINGGLVLEAPEGMYNLKDE